MTEIFSVDGLIFDLDGTLWDCSRASVEGFNRAYQELGIDRCVDLDFIHSIAGTTALEYNALLLDGVPLQKHERLLELLVSYEAEAIPLYAKEALYPNVVEGLRLLSEKYSLFLVSNCGELYLNAFLNSTQLNSLFTDVECFGRTQKKKKDNISLVIKRNALKNPCYVGDTMGDKISAEEAGILFMHAKYGFCNELESSHSFYTFQELVTYFLNSSLL